MLIITITPAPTRPVSIGHGHGQRNVYFSKTWLGHTIYYYYFLVTQRVTSSLLETKGDGM